MPSTQPNQESFASVGHHNPPGSSASTRRATGLRRGDGLRGWVRGWAEVRQDALAFPFFLRNPSPSPSPSLPSRGRGKCRSVFLGHGGGWGTGGGWGETVSKRLGFHLHHHHGDQLINMRTPFSQLTGVDGPAFEPPRRCWEARDGSLCERNAPRRILRADPGLVLPGPDAPDHRQAGVPLRTHHREAAVSICQNTLGATAGDVGVWERDCRAARAVRAHHLAGTGVSRYTGRTANYRHSECHCQSRHNASRHTDRR